MTTLADIKAHILADPQARAEYEAQAQEFDAARELIAARMTDAGTTEADHDEGTGGPPSE